MTLMIASLGAAGIALFVSGLPLWQPSSLRRRTLGVGARRSDTRTLLLRLVRPARGPGGEHDGDRLQGIVWGLAGAIGSAVFIALARDPRGGGGLLPAVVLCFAAFWAGYSTQRKVAVSRRRRRVRDIEEGLAAALDLLTIAMLSGESIQGAVTRVGAALTGPLGEEFHRLGRAVRSGTDLSTALKEMVERSGAPALRRTASTLITAIEKGAPIAEVLGAQADDLRTAKRSRLLESGGRREVMMLVPVVFLILPVVVLFALYPGLVTLDLLVP